MSYNYETMKVIMEGADLLYSMLGELTDGISALPGCKVTQSLKSLSANISAASSGIYHTMKNIAIDADEPCDECLDDAEEYDRDVPPGNDLRDFLDMVAAVLSSDKPVSISADIYINEEKGGDAKKDED